jgi:hemolysin III
MQQVAFLERPAHRTCNDRILSDAEDLTPVSAERFDSELDRVPISCAGAIEWNYDRAELIADAIIHIIGVSFGVIAAAILLALTIIHATPADVAAIVVYGVGLVTTLALSATYNLWPVCPAKWLLRRLDHSAIYFLIAATYTPFVVEMTNRALAAALLATLWSAAALGTAVKLALPGRFDRLSIAVYLIMGWSGLALYHTLLAGLPAFAVRFVIAGGVLYTIGVPFHLWQQLRFQNAIWHFFVLVATACHYAAVVDLVVT